MNAEDGRRSSKKTGRWVQVVLLAMALRRILLTTRSSGEFAELIDGPRFARPITQGVIRSQEVLMCIDRRLSSRLRKLKIGFLFLSACFLMAGCMSWNRGLEPLNPSYGLTWNSKVDTLTPTLKWKAYDDISGKEDIRYQLEIIEETTIILSKDDIRETYYTVDAQLDSNKEYQWRVRPVWQADGKTRRGQWNYRKYFFITPIIFGWGSKNYNFTTPKK